MQVFSFYRKVNTKGKWDTPNEGLAVSTFNDDISTINDLLKWMIDVEIFDPRYILFPKQETDEKITRKNQTQNFYMTLRTGSRMNCTNGKRNLVRGVTVYTVGTILMMKIGRGDEHGLFTISCSIITCAVDQMKLSRSA